MRLKHSLRATILAVPICLLALSGAALAAPATPAPTASSNPTVSGNPTQGKTLRAWKGSWTGSPTSYSYQWQQSSDRVSWSDINEATSETLTLSSYRAGKYVRVKVTASNGQEGAAYSASSPYISASAIRNQKAPGVNGEVLATQSVGGITYTVGSFSAANPYATGSGALFRSGESGLKPVQGFPQVTGGNVYKTIPDGDGGFYIGGDFTQVGGIGQSKLAHILANGALDQDFAPSLPSTTAVKALALTGGKLIYGGSGTQRIGAVDMNDGSAKTWVDNTSGGGAEVRSLAVSGEKVYAGGGFTSAGGNTHNRLAAFYTSNGATDNSEFLPDVDSWVYDIEISGSTLYIGGSFATVNGDGRANLAAVNLTDGTTTSFNAGTDNTVKDLDTEAGELYIAGEFTSVNGQARTGAAKLDSSGAVSSFDAGLDSSASAITVSGGIVYLSGNFQKAGGELKSHTASFDTSGVLQDWEPALNSEALSISAFAGTVYLGGNFSLAGGVPRQLGAAFDSDGILQSWNPQIYTPGSSPWVSDVEVTGGRIYLGGSFSESQGTARSNTAAYDTTSGVLEPWNPPANGVVTDLLAAAGGIYLAGEFTQIDGITRNRAAAWSQSDGLTAGTLDDFNPNLNNTVNSMLSLGGEIYLAGRFSDAGGTPRDRLTAVDPDTGAVSGSFNPGLELTSSPGNEYVNKIDTDGTDIYAAGYFNQAGAGNATRIGYAAFQTDNTLLAWAPEPDQYPNTAKVDDTNIYLGGPFSQVNSTNRSGFASADSLGALNPVTADQSLSYGNNVAETNSIEASGADLIVGGKFDQVSGENRTNLVKFDKSTGTLASWPASDTTPPTGSWTNPASPTNNTPLSFTLDFDEPINGLEAGDIENLGTATGCSIAVSGSTGTSFTVTVSSCSDGTIDLRLYSDSVQDSSENYGPASDTDSGPVELDTTPPSAASFTNTTQSPTKENNIDYALNFDETVSGLTAGDFTNAGTATGCSFAVAGSGDTYTVTASGCSEGTLIPELTANSVDDQAGNQGPASSAQGSTVTIDRTAPSVTGFTNTTQSPTKENNIDYALNFDETVSGLAAGDFTNTGTATGCSFAVSGSGDTYTVTVSGCSEGSLTPELAAGSVEDQALNQGPASSAQGSQVDIDRTAPEIAGFATTETNPSNSASIDYALSFTENVSGLTGGDFSNTGTATGCSFSVTGSGDTYTVAASGCSDGSLQPELAAGSVEDTAGNLGPTAAAAGNQIELDYTKPEASSLTTPEASPTNSSTINYTLSMSEPVSGLVDGEFANAGTASGCAFAVTGAGDSFNLEVSGCSSGTLRPELAQDAAEDAAGNQGPSAAYQGQEITLDYDKPEASWSTPSSPRAAGPMNYTLTFNEPVKVSDLGVDDLVLTGNGCSASSITQQGAGAYDTDFTVAITGCGAGDVDLGISGDATSDQAGNTGPTAQTDANTVTLMIIPANTALPQIADDGSPENGETLAADTGSWDNSPSSYGYQWLRCNLSGGACSPIGTNSSTYTLTDQDIGSTIRVQVIASNIAGASPPAESSQTTEIGGTPVNTSLPTIQGTPWINGTVSLDQPGTWYKKSGTVISYQWQISPNGSSGWADIPGETATSYSPTAGDDSKYLRLKETADSGASGIAHAYSTPIGPVRGQDPPVNTALPSISPATLGEGDHATGNDGSWSGDELNYLYQWMRCNDTSLGSCTDIPGATGLGYDAVAGDVGKRLRLRVVAYNLTEPLPGIIAHSNPTNPVNPPPSPPSNTSPPSISGTTRVGQTLTADPGTFSGFPAPSFSYQWQLCDALGDNCSAISGETGVSYTLQATDEAGTIRVKVTADNASGSDQATSAQSAIIDPLQPPVAVTQPSLPASGLVGTESSVTPGSFNGIATITLSYQWIRCDIGVVDTADPSCVNIGGADEDKYTPISQDAGKELWIKETATNPDGTDSQYSASGMLIEQAPTATTSPSVTGVRQEGEILSGDDGTWEAYPAATLSRQWVRCTTTSTGSCSDIGGETGVNYTLTPGDVGKYIRLKVTGTNPVEPGGVADYSSAGSQILPLPPVNTTAPSISGTLRRTYSLSANPGSWTNSPDSYSYEWQSCTTSGDGSSCSPVGSDQDSYVLQAADIGKYMRVKVTASNPGGSGNSYSGFTGEIEEFQPPVNNSPPSISGITRRGKTLASSNGSWSGANPINYTYQWRRCDAAGANCSDIAGATGASHLLTADDVGKTVLSRVTATNLDGSLSSDSSPSAVIAEPLNLPAPSITSAPSQKTRSVSVSFTGQAGASFECKVDSGAFAACSSPYTPSGLSDGAHSISVRQLLEDETSPPATVSFTLDTAAPAAPVITGAPAKETESSSASFDFTGEDGSSFECRLDSEDFKTCLSPVNYSGLEKGDHVFKVRQIDQAGNTSPEASFLWKIGSQDNGGGGTVDISVGSQVTVSGSGVASIGCAATGDSVEECSGEAYIYATRKTVESLSGRGKVKRQRLVIGRGSQNATADVSRLTVKIKLNNKGKKLLRRHNGPLRARFRIQARLKNSQKTLSAYAVSRMVPSRQLVLPSGGMFPTGSATPSRAGRRFIARLGRNLPRKLKGITCTGYTDSTGDADFNQQLGAERAEAVCKLIRSRGIRARYRIESMGERAPRASNQTARGRALNRRVEISLKYR